MNKNTGYEDSSIQVLEGLEAVRKRPGMYIGSTGPTGLHHLVWEIVDNAIDESLAGFCTAIQITILKDNTVVVKDNGRGIPVGINAQVNKSTVETVFTHLHAGGKFDNKAYKISGGLHGVGAAVVNALSTFLEVKVYRNNNVYYQRYERGGKPNAPLKIIDNTTITGTEIRFQPDPLVFQDGTDFKYSTLSDHIKQLAYLNPKVTISLTDERNGKKDVFHFPNGISDFVRDFNTKSEKLTPIIVFEGEENEIVVDIALQYSGEYVSHIFSFCNGINTYEGGTHEAGFKTALLNSLNSFASKNNIIKANDQNLTRDDVLEGITLVISIKHPDPQYEGQTKGKLANSDARKAVYAVTATKLNKYFLENPNIAKSILSKNLKALSARLAAAKARESTRRKDALEFSALPGKLADCTTKDRDRSELFIVEGNSAGGSAKLARNREFQAILPLRGKVLNVEKATISRVFGNAEISTIIASLDCGVENRIDLEKLRYGKVVIMTDADVDGSHIRILLLTFFFRYLRPLVENGNIFIAQPPLYKLQSGNKVRYAYSDKELEEYKATEFKNKNYGIQRYKGLGEMNPAQLWETTMDPGNRVLLQVKMDDAVAADNVFTSLMGDDAQLRRDFIEKNAKFVRNLDI